jgi:DNA-binding protein H-NS
VSRKKPKWRQIVEFENLSVEEIQTQLQKLDRNRSDLEKALEQRQQQAKYDLAQQIKDMIAEQGYDLPEMVRLISGRKRRGAAPTRKATGRQYTKYMDPDNPGNVYVRGVIPGWMKQKMQEQGYNPSSKVDRETFKASSLQVVE